MTGKELYQAGKLAEAITAVTAEVKSHPSDTAKRGFLAELLAISGQWERADNQLDALAQLDPQLAVGVSLFRQLLRAEQARQQFYAEGRLPEFLDRPPRHIELALEASIQVREGQLAKADESLKAAEEARPKVSCHVNGQAVSDFRDLDDLTSGVFEVLTPNGKFYWIPTCGVELVEFRKPERPRDLHWRAARVVVAGGPDGEVYLPCQYATSGIDPALLDDRARLGRVTDWQGGDGAPTRGVGLRSFLVGDEVRTILELAELQAGDEP